MLLILRHTDGRWCAPSISDGEITEEYAAKWVDAVCATLGFPVGTLTPHIVEDDADPRTGELIHDPNVAANKPVQEVQPSLADQVAELTAIVTKLAPDAVASSPVLTAQTERA